jgi:ribonuclease VapC
MSERPGRRESERGPSGPAEGQERGATSVVVDASALLAFVQDEGGADAVESALADNVRCGAANWSEVAQKVLAADRDWALVRALLISYEVRVDPVSIDDAEWAARRWKRGEGLSLADRLCLALAERVDTDVLTADTAWGSGGRVRQIR